jgi:hypothetical protein
VIVVVVVVECSSGVECERVSALGHHRLILSKMHPAVVASHAVAIDIDIVTFVARVVVCATTRVFLEDKYPEAEACCVGGMSAQTPVNMTPAL